MRKYIIFLMVAVTISIISVGYISTKAALVEKSNIQAAELKQKMDMDIADYTGNLVISKEQAIEAAKKAFPDLASSNNIKAQVNTMSYKGCTLFSDKAKNKNLKLKEKGYLDNSPVWIVSFKGLKIQRAGVSTVSDDLRKKSIHDEENVVIDATTGETLFSFTYR